jgi:hypothetical protein
VRRLVRATEESAAAEWLLLLCRASPAARQWLWDDFARDPKVQAAFRARVRQRNAAPQRFADLTDEGDAWREERRHLQAKIPPRLFGGLTWSALEELIAMHRAGRIDLGVFILAHEWNDAGRHASRSPLLTRAAVEFFTAAFTQPVLFRQMEHAIKLLRVDRSARRAALGYSDWWKLHVLFFVLRHPRSAYSIRELRAHLSRLDLDVSVKDVQRFCTSHGIKRDMRAGRPRKAPEAESTPNKWEHSRCRRPAITASDLHRL